MIGEVAMKKPQLQIFSIPRVRFVAGRRVELSEREKEPKLLSHPEDYIRVRQLARDAAEGIERGNSAPK